MTNEKLKLLVETVQQLSFARDLDTIMEVVRKTSRKLTGADGASFILKENDLCYYADEDAIGPLWKGQRFPIHSCISGWAMIHRQPAVIEDIYSDDRIPIEAYKPTFVKSLAMVPIRTMEPIGAIGNYWGQQHAPSSEEVQLLQSLADITSVSIENVYVYKELEERVKQRTRELELANNELETFSYSVSHDLRSPLHVISGLIGMLTELYGDKLDDEGKNITDAISRSAARMEALIDDLLTFSQLGKKDVVRSRLDMNELVQHVLAEVNRSMPNTALVDIRELHTVYADHSLIHQVLFNLVSNAVKYSSKGENPRIEIASAEHGGEIVFTIRDNGVGFDMHMPTGCSTRFNAFIRGMISKALA